MPALDKPEQSYQLLSLAGANILAYLPGASMTKKKVL
jgi:hypothetical protein